jgi:hypothetical protein
MMGGGPRADKINVISLMMPEIARNHKKGWTIC